MKVRLKEIYERTLATRDAELLQSFANRFAQLIIQECLTELESVKVYDYGRDDYDRGYDAGLTQAIETIKEHFEVK